VSDILQMSRKELDRAQVMRQLDERQIKARHAAEQLGLSIRQIRRLIKVYRREGAEALLSKKRGRPSHHQLDPKIKAQAVEWIVTRYADFGPTLAREKLNEVHHLSIGRGTVRRLMIQQGLWKPRRARRPVIHPLRERRARLGELIQIDGSPHSWFENRAPACTLLVFIDDATGRLMQMLFTAAESTFSYFEATERYVQQHGKPVAFYSDKLSVFRINSPNDLSGSGTTQFTRAMDQLGIKVICANTPQAKGRVEHIIQVLQDRLVKEMRLRGISHMAAGNAYLPEFIRDYNARFAVVPREVEDAHRPLLPSEDLARVLTVKEQRVLSKNLTVQYNKVIYQIQTKRPTYALRNATVVICQNRRGEIVIEYQGKPLAYSVYREQARQAEVVTSKQIALKLDELAFTLPKRKPFIPPVDHPWRRFKINARTKTSNPPR
jgi:transposase